MARSVHPLLQPPDPAATAATESAQTVAPALADAAGTHSYAELTAAAERVALALLAAAGSDDLQGRRVALLAPPGLDFTACFLGIWRAGGTAVPLATVHPPAEHEHALSEAEVDLVLAHPDDRSRLASLAAERSAKLLTTRQALAAAPQPPSRPRPAIEPESPALVLFTSGTTGRPKAALLSHRAVAAQVDSMVRAWGWQAGDRLLHLLPLHHTHGLVNCLLTPLAVGACCEIAHMPDGEDGRPGRFDAATVWRRLAAGGVTVLMAVPTIWVRLVEAFEAAESAERESWGAAARELRLAVSGSAALPAALAERWRTIAGEIPLERYGMTEIGMALGNPLDGRRVAGAVGGPMPGVEVRRVDEAGEPVTEGTAGEVEVRGPQVFSGYLGRPLETARAFRDGGWFRTGDVALEEGGVYRILGRRSVDILDVGGYKLSALEIEQALAEHPGIAECAVVGTPDERWGQRVAVAIVPSEAERPPTLALLREWAAERLAPYKLPTRLRVLDQLPRNPLGKVVKPQLVGLFAPPESPPEGSGAL